MLQISNTSRRQSDDLFHSSGQVSSRAEYSLSLALEHIPSATIIITNFKDIAIFSPPTRDHPEPTVERISTAQPSSPDLEVDEDVVLSEGPPQDPHEPLLEDEEVFANYRRHFDFDMATLVRDRARALQFFRWHEHVSKKFAKLVAHPKDTLTAKTNDVGQIVPDIRPFDASKISSDTAAHLKAIQRESPLVTAGAAELFKQSKCFTLQIQDVVAEGSERGICTVYCCQITSIDNVPVSI